MCERFGGDYDGRGGELVYHEASRVRNGSWQFSVYDLIYLSYYFPCLPLYLAVGFSSRLMGSSKSAE